MPFSPTKHLPLKISAQISLFLTTAPGRIAALSNVWEGCRHFYNKFVHVDLPLHSRPPWLCSNPEALHFDFVSLSVSLFIWKTVWLNILWKALIVVEFQPSGKGTTFCADYPDTAEFMIPSVIRAPESSSTYKLPSNSESFTIFLQWGNGCLSLYAIPFCHQKCWCFHDPNYLLLVLHNASCPSNENWSPNPAFFFEMLSGRASCLQCLPTAVCYESGVLTADSET